MPSAEICWKMSFPNALRLCENSFNHGLTRIFTDTRTKPAPMSFWKNLFKKRYFTLTQERFPSSGSGQAS
jgi:hypothetical protein